MKLEAARLQDAHSCPGTDPKAHVGGPVVGPGAPRVFIEGRNAALLADSVGCVGAMPSVDLVKRGAAKVLAHGLPLVRRTDACLHGGTVDAGATRVFVGGPIFEVPANFVLDGPLAYQNRVIRDLFFLSTIPTGRDFLGRLAGSGRRVRIRCADGELDKVDGPSGPGELEEIVVSYDSTSVRYSYGDDGAVVPEPPQTRLAHELIHAVHDAEGTTLPPSVRDPSPDEAYDDMNTGKSHQPPMEESVTTGSGAAEGLPLTENQVRKELGLPPRDKYFAPSFPAHDGQASDLRPGAP